MDRCISKQVNGLLSLELRPNQHRSIDPEWKADQMCQDRTPTRVKGYPSTSLGILNVPDANFISTGTKHHLVSVIPISLALNAIISCLGDYHPSAWSPARKSCETKSLRLDDRDNNDDDQDANSNTNNDSHSHVLPPSLVSDGIQRSQ